MKLGIVGALLMVIAVAVAAYFIAKTPDDTLGSPPLARPTPLTQGESVDYTVGKGKSASDVGGELQKLGVIRSSAQFQTLLSLMGLESKISAGDYTLNKGSSALTAISILTVKDAIPTIRVTFIEGSRTEEMAAVAEKAGFGPAATFMDAVAAAKLPEDLAATLPAGQSLQGYLFPDTYILPAGSTPQQLVDLMIKTFALRFSPALRAAAQTQGLTPHQALTLASIVEREAVLAPERPLIAGVFYNRIAAVDRLGADPTVQFAVATAESVAKNGWWKKELTKEDLAIASPYNTRLNPGLPPGPISNPGLASIEAVANPTKTKFYYFVADAKKADGSHVFAETLEQHQANIARVGGQ